MAEPAGEQAGAMLYPPHLPPLARAWIRGADGRGGRAEAAVRHLAPVRGGCIAPAYPTVREALEG
eukprot:3779139-Pleurochrysis_carterae.AAC.1